MRSPSKCAARPTTRRVDREYRDTHLRKTREKTIENFIGNAALTGATRTGNTDNRHLPGLDLPLLSQACQLAFIKQTFLYRRNHCRDSRRSIRWLVARQSACGRLRARNEIFDHRLQPEFHTIMRVIDALDTVFHQSAYLLRRNRAATATEYLDVAGTQFTQTIHHVTEKLVMAALIGADSNTVRILLNRRKDDVINTAIVTQVHDLDALSLDQSSHYVNCGIVAVK